MSLIPSATKYFLSSFFVFGLLLTFKVKAHAETPVSFVQSLCKAAQKNDDAFLSRHVLLPLPTKQIASEGGGNPVYQNKKLRTLVQVKDLLSACDDLSFARAKEKRRKKDIQVEIGIGQFYAYFWLKNFEDSFVLLSVKI